jgi:hypothetical protein
LQEMKMKKKKKKKSDGGWRAVSFYALEEKGS